MKTVAASAGIFLLATLCVDAQTVSGVNVSGGATPSVSASASATSGSQSGSSSVSNTSGELNQRTNVRSGNASANNNFRSTISSSPRSQSSARGGTGQAVGNQVQTNLTVATDPGGYTGSGGSSGYSGSFTQTLRNTPEIVAPNVVGGANGCAVGVSGGVSVAGFGVTTGAGWSDPDCERRNLAALAYNTGDHDLAAEILCDAKEVRAARARLGKPCLADVALAQAAHVALDPAIIRREQETTQPVIVAQPMMSVAAHPAMRPDWCLTSSPEELRKHTECDAR